MGEERVGKAGGRGRRIRVRGGRRRGSSEFREDEEKEARAVERR